MTGTRRAILISLLLVLSGGPLLGASSEEKSFNAAARNLQDGLWEPAATGFRDFVIKYPESQRAAEAILYRAQATITNGQYAGAIELLTTNQFRAGGWRDQYLFWIGQAQLRNADYPAAANTFLQLLENFPASFQRFDAALAAATALSKLEQWPRVIQLLQDTNGVFQQAAQVGVANEGIPNGYLLLGEAYLAQTNFGGVDDVLRLLDAQKLPPELAWRRGYLLCRRQLAADLPLPALQTVTNLNALAAAAGNRRLQAETTVLEAGIQERLGHFEDAIATWQKNLTNAPAEQQRRALLKIAALSLALDKPADAVRMLERFLDQQPASGAADLAVLTIGELDLRQYLDATGTNSPNQATNLMLNLAAERFDQVLRIFTNSPWTGKALLDRGWCLWLAGQVAPSEDFFRRAAQRLQFSEEQAVARFKWADAQFTQDNFAGALTNYLFVVTNFTSRPEFHRRLLEQALYRAARAAVEITNLPAASDALGKILDWYPDGFAGDRTLLMVGEGFLQRDNPARARELFARFETLYPSSPLLPELRLAKARTYEQEGDWTAAITNYEAWIATFTNSLALRPRAEFCLAVATAKAGQETNALSRLTDFVARFPSDEQLAPRAQYGIGLYYHSHRDWIPAEKAFWYLVQNWTNSELACPAEMMAGESAMARGTYKDAIGYFSSLYTNASCGTGLKIEAAIRAGDAYVSWTDTAATNRLAHLQDALSWFESAVETFPTNAQAPTAWFKIANCNLQWAALDAQRYVVASNAYRHVLTFSNAPPSVRFDARLGLAVVAEKTGDDQAALRHCLEVLNAGSDAMVDRPSQFQVKEAGRIAGQLAEKLNLWWQAANIYTNLGQLLPARRSAYDRLAAAARERIPTN